MSRLSLAIVAVLALSLGNMARAQVPGNAANPGTVSLTPPSDAPPVLPAPPGPYAVTVEANPGLITHTIYRPADLKPFTGAKRLPIVAWGNGACSNAGLLFQNFLTNVASSGFVVIVSGAWSMLRLQVFAAPQAGVPRLAPGSPPSPMTKDADLITAIDWAIRENERPGSPYFHRLDPDKVAVMGQSCGTGLPGTGSALRSARENHGRVEQRRLP